MARKRNYAAEYQARQARSQARYGVSYGKQRRLVERGQRTGLSPTEVRKTLKTFKDKTRPDQIVSRLISVKGSGAEWDPFGRCVNTDNDGEECGHIPGEHYIRDPHPCTECTCPKFIHPDGLDEYPEHLFYYK